MKLFHLCLCILTSGFIGHIHAGDNAEIFSAKFGNHIAKTAEESHSGKGSDMIQTAVIRQKIPELLEQLNCNYFVDAPCGDFFWMKKVPVNGMYIGCDVIQATIDELQKKYGNRHRYFLQVDFCMEPIPYGDLVLCRDCLVHHTYSNIAKILRNFKASDSKYLLTTTFPTHANAEITTGEWRPLNLTAAPFHFPPPILIINEGCTEGNGFWHDKSLALWKMEDIPDTFIEKYVDENAN